jgi:hypothetical protein
MKLSVPRLLNFSARPDSVMSGSSVIYLIVTVSFLSVEQIVEQFVEFFIKIEQIFDIKSRSEVLQGAIFKIIRILFRYADNRSELCSVKI